MVAGESTHTHTPHSLGSQAHACSQIPQTPAQLLCASDTPPQTLLSTCSTDLPVNCWSNLVLVGKHMHANIPISQALHTCGSPQIPAGTLCPPDTPAQTCGLLLANRSRLRFASEADVHVSVYTGFEEDIDRPKNEAGQICLEFVKTLMTVFHWNVLR